MCGRIVSSHAEEDGIVLDHGAILVDEQRARLEVLAAHLGEDVVLDVDAERREVGDLIELAVVSGTGVPEELQFGEVAIGSGTADVADIAEAAADIDVGFCVGATGGSVADEVEWDGIHEVRAVGTLEDAEQGAVGTLRTRCRGVANARDDVRFAKVETHPTERAGRGTVVGRGIAVEGLGSRSLCAGEHHRALQLMVHRAVVGTEHAVCKNQGQQERKPARYVCLHFLFTF